MRRLRPGVALVVALLAPLLAAIPVARAQSPDSLRDAYANQPPRVPPGSDIGPWSDPWAGDIRLRYNRVDGALVGGRLTARHEGAFERQASAELSLATAREKGVFRVEGSQALRADNRIHLDGEAYRLTLPFEYDREIVGDMENTLAAAFFRDDYRDWYEGLGGRLALRWRSGTGLALRAAAGLENQRPLRRAATWGVFDTHPFRENPAATPGHLGTLRLELTHDSRHAGDEETLPFIAVPRAGRGDAVRVTAEAGGGDFRYFLLRLDARGWWRVTHGQSFSARVLAGRTFSGDGVDDLPAQKLFRAGGISTLRGHGLKAFSGDELLLVNAEYSVALYRNFSGFVGADLGRAWLADRVSAPRFALDGVAGLQTQDGRLRLQWGRDLRRAGAPVIFSVRTRAAF